MHCIMHCIIIVINCNFMLKLLQYGNYIFIVMQIKLMFPLRELPLSVFPLSGVGCGAATRRLYLHSICGFLFVSFSRQQKGYLIFGQAFVARMLKKRQISHFFTSALYLDKYVLIHGEGESKTRNKTRTRYEPFTRECCSRLYMRRHVRTKTRLTHSLVHSSSHLVFFSTLFSSDSCLLVKQYLPNRETFTLCGSKKEGEDEMRREGFFHANK